MILHRIDAAKNMHRFYRLDVRRDLFGHENIVDVPGGLHEPEDFVLGQMLAAPIGGIRLAAVRYRPADRLGAWYANGANVSVVDR
jgi:hypothetical protein